MAMPQISGARAPILQAGVTTKLSFTATQARTPGPVSKDVHIVRLVATETCHVAFGGPAVAATVNDLLLPAGVVEYFQVVPNASFVSAIQSATNGILYVTEMN